MIHDIALEVEKEYGKKNISVISARSGHDRKTVRKYLESGALTVERRKREYHTKLEPFKPYIQERLTESPELTVTRILEELQGMGFDGQYTIVKDYVRSLRGHHKTLAVYRYETKPGHQAQCDWGDLGLLHIDGEDRHLYIFTMILGYSRMRFAECTFSTNLETLIKCHIDAFEYFGGVPEEILYDNMKTVISKKAFNPQDSQLNQGFKDFADYYGFTIRTCKPYMPKTKGKIENTVKYLKRDFFYGRSFSSFTDLSKKLVIWLDKVNTQKHGTTQELPVNRLKIEQPKLKDIHTFPPYQTVLTESRKVTNDSYISYLGNKYSVPYHFANRDVTLKVSGGSFTVFCNNEELCSHEIVPGKNRRIRVKEHFTGLLSETLKQNSKKSYSGRPILHFENIDVQNRSLEVYEQFGLGGDKQ